MLLVDKVPIEGFNVVSNVACDESQATGDPDIVRKLSAEGVFNAAENRDDRKKMNPFQPIRNACIEVVDTSVDFLVGLHKQSLFVDTIIVVVVPKACEVMGNALTIYSDKTDALTQNQMQAVSRIIRTSLQLEGLQHGESTGASTSMDTIGDTSISKPAEMLDNPFKDLLLKSVTLNSAALVGEVGSGKAFIDFDGD
ncbi:uncharacterized protein FTOL_08646 [Fusarium torulosum]|uniref:Uncharacterized protein n=1 Tax=Fusarium torulosum TaxID=33205 RepID=A0AAE8MD45_9HYPO|nr:uncharacterized protein FTOL_08646 [Fusarium torulosum]